MKQTYTTCCSLRQWKRGGSQGRNSSMKLNEELNRLTGNKNIINYIKAQRLAWFGHIHRMPDNSMVKKYMSGHPH